jgi:hypothetical protein
MSEQKITNQHQWDRVSITPSGFFGSSSKNIVELENFMTEEEVVLLNDFIRSNTNWDLTESHYNEDGICIYDASYWEDRVAGGSTLHQHAIHIYDMINNMMGRLTKKVNEYFRVDAWPTSPTIVRWNTGNLQYPHADKELHKYEEWGGHPDREGQPNDFPFYDIAGLFYINDDYEGGELYFPEQNIQFKPKKGAAYFFPGDRNYIHGVTEITSGTRYTCPFFFTILKHFNKDGSEKGVGPTCRFED